MTTTITRQLASGRVAILDDDGRVLTVVDPDTAESLVAQEDGYAWGTEGRTCSICDGVGHGYPGGGPCPLEDYDYSDEPAWAL